MSGKLVCVETFTLRDACVAASIQQHSSLCVSRTISVLGTHGQHRSLSSSLVLIPTSATFFTRLFNPSLCKDEAFASSLVMFES
jgi:hypothetical protein